MALQKRNVRTDGDQTAVAGAAFGDLQPALIGELHFRGARQSRLIGVGHAALDDRAGCSTIDDGAFRAGHKRAVWKTIGLLEVRVAHHQTIVLVPQDKGFGRALDGVGKALIGLGITLCQTVLFGHVHGDADDARAVCGVDHLRTGAQPDIMTMGVAHAENLIDLAQITAADRACQLIEVSVFGMHHARRIAEGERFGTRREAEDFVK